MLQRFQAFAAGITTCHRYIQRIKAAEMTEFGLKGTHVMCLFYLDREPEGMTAAQLCQSCCEDKAAVSRTLGELEERGYVSIRREDGKKYRALIFLTESGREITRRMNGIIEEWVATGGDGLTDEERDDFYRCLGVIADNLGEKLKNTLE